MRSLLLMVVAGTVLGGSAFVLSEPFDQCGQLWEVRPGCILIQPFQYSEIYVTDLPSLPDSLADIAVRIRGHASFCESDCGPYYYYCVSGAVATVCAPTDLGCGVLNEDTVDHCHTWHSPVYGTLLTQMHGYSDGDTVRVVGIIDCSTPTTCDMGCILWTATFYDCPDTLTVVEHRTWGGLKCLFK